MAGELQGAACSDPNTDLLLAVALKFADRLLHGVSPIRISGEAYDWLRGRSSCLRIFVEFDNVNKVALDGDWDWD
jgi:hypothetical protein